MEAAGGASRTPAIGGTPAPGCRVGASADADERASERRETIGQGAAGLA